MKKLASSILFLTALIMLVIPSSEARSPDSIQFGYKSSALTPSARSKLDQMALDLKHLKSIMISSCVPSVGDASLNQQFANERVEAVKQHLIGQGVDANAISTQAIPCNRQRSVEISYGAGATTPTTSAMPPPPAPTSTPPPAATPPPPPPPAKEPVITAEPEKKYESGLTESTEKNVVDEKVPYLEPKAAVPSRWDY